MFFSSNSMRSHNIVRMQCLGCLLSVFIVFISFFVNNQCITDRGAFAIKRQASLFSTSAMGGKSARSRSLAAALPQH